MMKHRISAFLLAVLLAVTAAGCSAQEPEDSAGLPESSAGTAVRSEAFYPAEAGYTDYDGSPVQGRSGWNADGTFTFQNRNTLTTLSRENQVLETITLPEEALPGSEYSLDRSDDYILTLSNPGKMNESYGAVYYTDSGTVCLANLTLFDRQGNLVRQYPRSQVYGYDENDQKICLLPCPEGEEVAEVYGLGGAMPIYWLDGHTAIFDCHSFIIFYDFAADSGQVLDDMNEIAAQFGRFSTYCGSQMGGVVDGTYYYLTQRGTDPISGYTLWAADADGAGSCWTGSGSGTCLRRRTAWCWWTTSTPPTRNRTAGSGISPPAVPSPLWSGAAISPCTLQKRIRSPSSAGPGRWTAVSFTAMTLSPVLSPPGIWRSASR